MSWRTRTSPGTAGSISRTVTRRKTPAKVSLTRIIRGHIKDGAWTDEQTIFQAPLEVYPGAGGVHFGGRIVFDGKGYIFFSIGERGRGPNAQDLTVPWGKSIGCMTMVACPSTIPS